MSVISSEQVYLKELSEKQEGRVHSRVRDVDRHVGERIRQRRLGLCISQQELAELIGVSNQQAHKYEKGINRITAGRLYVFAQALAVDIAFFFEGLDDNRRFASTAQGPDLMELTRNFVALSERSHQVALSSLTRLLANSSACDPVAPAPAE
jgi:transcriptional regulator with XRE-family HTH domain